VFRCREAAAADGTTSRLGLGRFLPAPKEGDLMQSDRALAYLCRFVATGYWAVVAVVFIAAIAKLAV